MLDLTTPTTVKLDSAKARKEFHGEAKVLALDTTMTWKTHNSALNMFNPALRTMLFTSVPPGEKAAPNQDELDLAISELPYVRCPEAGYPMKLPDLEWLGHTLRLDWGRGGDSDKILNLCKMKGFQFTPIEGGSVEIHWSLSSAADITGKVVGIFSDLIQQDIVITLLKPKEEEQKNLIDASKDGDAPGANKEPEKTAQDEFIAQHGKPAKAK